MSSIDNFMGVLEGGPTNTCPQKLETGLSEVVNYYYDFVCLDPVVSFFKVKNLGQKCDKRISSTSTTTLTTKLF